MRFVMPVRSLTSPVFKWPTREDVVAALEDWAARQYGVHPELVRIGYFGSMANGTWGFGSDVDLVAVVRESKRPMIERPLDWDTTPLPVPADLLVYTEEEFAQIAGERSLRGDDMRGVRWLARG